MQTSGPLAIKTLIIGIALFSIFLSYISSSYDVCVRNYSVKKNIGIETMREVSNGCIIGHYFNIILSIIIIILVLILLHIEKYKIFKRKLIF